MNSDKLLVSEAAAGSRAAFDELVRRNRQRVYNLVKMLTDGDPDAEDLTQEVFVRAFRGIRRFRGDSSIRTWLYRIAINVVKSHVGRAAQGRLLTGFGHREQSDDAESWTERLAARTDLERDLARRQLIDQALATLPGPLRVVVVLRDIQGLDYKEIAQVTGVPLGTVQSRLHRARRRLRPLLEPLRGRSGQQVGWSTGTLG